MYHIISIGPPSAPRNLIASNVTNTTVFLQWDAPLDDGNRFDLFYTITENVSNISYDTINTNFLLENLLPLTYYDIYVTADNGVSLQDPVIDYRTVSVQIMTSKCIISTKYAGSYMGVGLLQVE